MKSILDPSFKYIPAASTDINKTFARIKKEMAEQAKPQNVTELKRKLK